MTSISSNMGSPEPSVSGSRMESAAVQVKNAAPAPQVTVDTPVQEVKEAGTEPRSKYQANAEDVKRISEKLQQRVSAMAPELQFSVDQSNGKTVMKFTDKTTNEVIQQYPSEAVMQIGKALDRYEKNFLLNSKA